MTETATNPAPKAKGKNDKIYLLLVLLLLGTNASIAWMWWNEKGKLQVVTVTKENKEKDAEIAKQELIALQAQYQTLTVNNEQIQSEINLKKEEIAQLQKELEKHKDNAYIIAKLRKETNTLRDIMKHFVEEIDSLNTVNKKITAEKEVVKAELKVEKEKNTVLSKENENLQNTVNIASMLKAVGIQAVGVIDKKGGKKEIESSKAKRAGKIRISFTLAENLVAKQGEYIVYARIVTPDGKELAQSEDEAHTFSFGKSKGYWASKKSVNYQNENTAVIMYAHPKDGELFVKGKYMIEVTAGGYPIGNTTLELE